MRPIVTLTLNPAIDASCQADEVGPVRKIRTFDERYDPGGGGINVARVAGRRRSRWQWVPRAGRPGKARSARLSPIRRTWVGRAASRGASHCHSAAIAVCRRRRSQSVT
jgi:hypothetical protein